LCAGAKGTHRRIRGRAPFRLCRVRVDGNMYELDEWIALEKNKKHTVEIVVDRLVVNDECATAWRIPSRRPSV
jgi:excinuclease ABC subunit A